MKQEEMVSVPMKLMKEAHAVMWETGWHNAYLYQKSDDGIIEAAASEIERKFAEITGFGK